MSGSRAEQIKALFEEVSDLHADQRQSFLQDNCPPDLRAEVEELLNHHDATKGNFLEGTLPNPDNPKQIGEFRIERRIGQGGMGVVYRAVQTSLNRIVALKLLPTIVASPQSIRWFQREAKAAARLHHTNIVPIYAFGESREGYFYAMELIDGQPLNDLITKFAHQNITAASQARVASVLNKSVRGLPISPANVVKADDSSALQSSPDSSSSTGKGRAYYQQVARWMADAADALHYAHNEGIIHRDIKPGNMLLSRDGRILITDFGLAKCSDDKSVTIAGLFMGAIRYVSPEQAMAGRVRIDHRTDIYSLGATMYELLALQPAFSGRDDKEILAAIIARDPIPLRKLVPTLPTELETICQKTLEKLPEARYDTARALAEDLRRFLNDLPIIAKPPGPISRSLKYAKRHKAMTTAAVAAVLLVASMAFILHLREVGRAGQIESFTSEAVLSENKKKWPVAVEKWRQALKLDAGDPVILYGLARSLQEYHDRLTTRDPLIIAEAMQCYENAKLIRTDPLLENLYGVLLTMGGRYDEALAVFEKDLKLDEKAPWTWLNVAGVYFLREDDNEVRKALNKSIEHPFYKDGRRYCFGYREMATFYLLQKDPAAINAIDEAENCEGKALKQFSYHLIRARVLLLLGGKESIGEAKNAAKNASSDWDEDARDRYIERYLSLAYLRNDESAKALETAKRAQEAGDLPVYTNLLIACAQARLGNHALARKALQEADDNWPDDLKEVGAIRRSLHLGFLWFESEDELSDLRSEAQRLLTPPHATNLPQPAQP